MEAPRHDRYDKIEDRNNDIKRHDNPRHSGMISHIRHQAIADNSLREWEDDNNEDLTPFWAEP